MLTVENEHVVQLLAAESFLHCSYRLLFGPILAQLELPVQEGSLVPTGVALIKARWPAATQPDNIQPYVPS